MKLELQKQLFDKYPLIFQDKDKSMQETCMCWGIECNDGWYWLLDRLCSNLQWNTDHNNKAHMTVYRFEIIRKLLMFIARKNNPWLVKNKGKKYKHWIHKNMHKLVGLLRKEVEYERYPQIIASQVKEKYGGLRFYVQSSTGAQDAVISWAESLSYHICDKCGSTENIGSTEGWIITLCEKCSKLEEYNNRIWEKNK